VYIIRSKENPVNLSWQDRVLYFNNSLVYFSVVCSVVAIRITGGQPKKIAPEGAISKVNTF